MKEISLENLPDSALLTTSVYLDNRYILLSPDTPVTPQMKKRLKEWDFPTLYAEGEFSFRTIDLESDTPDGTLVQQSNEEAEAVKEARDFLEKSYRYTRKVYAYFIEHGNYNFNELAESIKGFQTMIKSHRSPLLMLINQDNPDMEYNVAQALKTTLLTLILCDHLKMPAHKQMDLGTACLLHRLGMFRIPKELRKNDTVLNAEQKKLLTAFPILGFRMLKDADFPMPVALAVLEHREHLDGSGYPRHIRGNQMSIYGKIISITSSYCASVAKAQYKQQKDGHTGILDIMKNQSTRYDKELVGTLVQVLSVYPIGTYLLLSNGAIGEVVKTDPNDARFPILKLLRNESGEAYMEKPILHTGEKSEIKIVRVLTPQERDNLEKNLSS